MMHKRAGVAQRGPKSLISSAGIVGDCLLRTIFQVLVEGGGMLEVESTHQEQDYSKQRCKDSSIADHRAGCHNVNRPPALSELP